MKDQEFQLKSEAKDRALKYELRVKGLERMVEVLDGRVQHVGTEKEKKIAGASCIRPRSCSSWRRATPKKLQQQLSTPQQQVELRIKIMELGSAARLAEKDRRIEIPENEKTEMAWCIYRIVSSVLRTLSF